MKTYNIVAIFADDTHETLSTGYTCEEDAWREANRMWRDDYGSGRAAHPSWLGHSSGIVDIGTVAEGEDS